MPLDDDDDDVYRHKKIDDFSFAIVLPEPTFCHVGPYYDVFYKFGTRKIQI